MDGNAGSNDYCKSGERRNVPRFGLLECGVIWQGGQDGPKRLGTVVVTNASMGGLQLRSQVPPPHNQRLMLELGSEDGPLFLPGEVRYVNQEDGVQTFGFKFVPESDDDRKAVARYVLMLANKASAKTLDWSSFSSDRLDTHGAPG
ncbi:MAG: hypothetical protein C4341_05265 [Armatimonadota bacterium]